MPKQLGEVIQKRREEIGMSQAELASAVSVSLRQIRRYESGEQQPVLDVAVRLAEALDISLNQLAGRSDAPRPVPDRADRLARHETELKRLRRQLDELQQQQHDLSQLVIQTFTRAGLPVASDAVPVRERKVASAADTVGA